MLPTIWDTIPALSPSRDCFADEIAIDFPSVDHAVEKLRSAFLGEAPSSSTLTTEVRVTTREAALGTVVSLDVPVRRVCAPCGGRGEVWTEICAECAGSGDTVEHHPLRVPLPPGVANGSRFRFRVSSPGALPVRVEVRVAIAPAA